ncbi:MAG: beta-N-acetylglucosaminidase domain-containing protein [Halioglobus sp.]
MGTASHFLTGVIEGFYGRDWSWESRQHYATYLKQLGLNTYLYCPKSDSCLRRTWHDSWPTAQRQQLEAVGRAYTSCGLNWGVGLSPYGLYLDYGSKAREQLRRKIDELGALGAPLLAVLFDDMPGDVEDLAERQAQIVNDIARWLPDTRLLVCPTYYSFDPVLERHFGAMPRDYWPELGRLLPVEVDIFWTGNRVCSEAIQSADIARIHELLGRAVTLWDNYPVNDGAIRSRYLYARALPERDRSMQPLLRGHLCNPMNQALLSLPALLGLAGLYESGSGDEHTLSNWLGEAFWQRFRQDAAVFEDAGLDGIGEKRCRDLAAVYAQIDAPAAREVSDWLSGRYRFDPSCLTD